MAFNEAQEKEILGTITELKSTLDKISPIAAEVPALKAQLTAKQTELDDLKSKFGTFRQEGALGALKTKYPDVPESTLLAIPEASREAEAAKLQEAFSKVKVTPTKTDPRNPWANTGGIAPLSEAEELARKQQERQELEKAKSEGNLSGVIRAKSRTVAGWIRKSLAPAA